MYRALGKEIKKAFRQDRVINVLDKALNSGPFDGGCLVVAKALVRLVPECKVVTIVRNFGGKDIPDHYAVGCPDGGIIDADGYAPGPQSFIKRFLKNESVPNDSASYRVEPCLFKPPHGVTNIDDPRAVRDLVRELRAAISTF